MSRFASNILLLMGVVVSAPAVAATPIEAGATVSAASVGTPVNFEIFLPVRNPSDLERLLTAQQTPGSSTYHKWVTPAQYAAQFGPTPDAMAKAQAAATALGLQVSTTNARSFHVSGTVGQITAMFGTTFKSVHAADGSTRILAAGPLKLPSTLAAAGAEIISFNGLPNKRTFAKKVSAAPIAANRYGPVGPYWYNDLKQAYDYPSYNSFLPNGQRLDGTGVRVAVLMADLLYPGDVDAYFNHENFTATTGKPVPVVATHLINGGGTVGGPAAIEASLDVQQILGGAPGSSVTLVSLPNLSDANIADGYNYIVNSGQYDVVNSSFGGCEAVYGKAYNEGTDFTYLLRISDEIFKQGSAEGITFVASSGDNGGLECPSVDYFYKPYKSRFVKSVSTPASSTYVTAVGGGNLVTASDGTRNSAYVGENASGDPLIPYDVYGFGANVSGGYWGAGGGRSIVFAQPPYQVPINTGSKMRTLPDIGMQVGGCPGGISQTPCGPNRSAVITAYGVRYGMGFYGLIGTSVSSPEFVGALALFIQKQGGRVGNINNYLYHYGQAQTLAGGVNAPPALQFYHRNITGFDGAWADNYPSQNYNYLNGNGTPDVRKLFGFTSFEAAGVPQSSSNP